MRTAYASWFLCIALFCISQPAQCIETVGELSPYNARISYAVCGENARLLDSVGSVAAFRHHENVIICQSSPQKEDVITNIFKFVGNHGLDLIGGAFSQNGRFLTISNENTLKSKQSFYIFQSVGMLRQLLQTMNASPFFVALPKVLCVLIMSYITEFSESTIQRLSDQQYFLYNVITLDLEKVINATEMSINSRALSEVEFRRFQLIDSAELVCYPYKLQDPTVVFNLINETAELRKPDFVMRGRCTASQNARFVYGTMNSEAFLLDRLHMVRTPVTSHQFMAGGSSIDNNGNYMVRSRLSSNIALDIYDLKAKEEMTTICCSNSRNELITVCLLNKDECLLMMKNGMFKLKNTSYASSQIFAGHSDAFNILADLRKQCSYNGENVDMWTFQQSSLPPVPPRVMITGDTAISVAKVYAMKPVPYVEKTEEVIEATHDSPVAAFGFGSPELPNVDSDSFSNALPSSNRLARRPLLIWYKRPDWWLKGMAISTVALGIAYGTLRWWNADGGTGKIAQLHKGAS